MIDQRLLRLYIAYAKAHCHPTLQHADTEKMIQARRPRRLLPGCHAREVETKKKEKRSLCLWVIARCSLL